MTSTAARILGLNKQVIALTATEEELNELLLLLKAPPPADPQQEGNK